MPQKTMWSPAGDAGTMTGGNSLYVVRDASCVLRNTQYEIRREQVK
jgi:hypothetical protein